MMWTPQCGLSEDEARVLVNMAKGDGWPVFRKYTGFLKDMALDNLRRRNITAEDTGYYKGILQIVEDIEAFPSHLANRLYADDVDDDEVSLDDMSGLSLDD
jgi:hypothetical protein